MTHRNTLTLRTYGMSVAHAPVSFDRGPAWMTNLRRACAPQHGNADLFTSDVADQLNAAAKLCRDECPFLAECDAWASARKEPHGVWGGMIRSPKGSSEPGDQAEIAAVSYHHFLGLSHEEQAQIIQNGLDSGATLSQLAQRYHAPITTLQEIIGHAGPTFDEEVEQKFRAGLSDLRIAADLKVHPKTIATHRSRLGLVRQVGRPRKQVAA